MHACPSDGVLVQLGLVYKARHHGLKRLVALKMIRDGSLARAEGSFRST